MVKIKLYTFLMMIALGLKLKGQVIPDVIPASPEAMAMAKYINYPVDYSTGIPDITIPLFDIQSGGLTLPLELRYHASGVKPLENAGWIGTGWSLKAEPMITRSIKGNVDEAINGYLSNNNLGNINNDPSYYHLRYDGSYDEEPDEFYYSLLGKSGSFFYHKAQRNSNEYSIKTVPSQPIRISKSSTESAFYITDDDGTRYNFGKSITGEGYYEITEHPGSGLPLGTTTWKAAEIISASSRDTISFKYSPTFRQILFNPSSDHVFIQDSTSHPWYMFSQPPGAGRDVPAVQIEMPIYQGINGLVSMFYLDPISNQLSPGAIDYSYMDGAPTHYFNNTRKIQEIQFKGNRVVFEMIGQVLSDITVYNAKNEVQRQIKLYTSNLSTYGSSNTRLWLDSVVISDKNLIRKMVYKFDYYNQNMPDYHSKETDYWGYFNSNSAGQQDINIAPQNITVKNNIYVPSSTITVGAVNRNANSSVVYIGMLKRVTWPTGGFTEYEFESNKYRDSQEVIKEGGGLRVSSITAFNAAQSVQSKRVFKYGTNEDGAGIIKNDPKQADFIYQQNLLYYEPTFVFFEENVDDPVYQLMISLIVQKRKRTLVSSSLQDMFYSQGTPVVYKEVAEYQIDYVEANNGKTVYVYNNDPLYNCINCHIPYTTMIMDTKNSWSWGELLSKTVLKKNTSNGFDKIYAERYQYESIPTGDQIFVGKVYKETQVIGDVQSDIRKQLEHINWIHYNITPGRKVLKKKEIVEYK